MVFQNPRRMLRVYAPNFREVGYYFKRFLDRYITPGCRLLDVGCGRRTFGREYYERACFRAGVDMDRGALAENTVMDEKYACSIEELPALEPFDVVVAQWVLEHIENPERVCAAIARLTKPGGYFIFMTTNSSSPIIWISRIIPTNLKKRVLQACCGREERDTYKTSYKINNPLRIDEILMASNFQKVEVVLVPALGYFAFTPFTLIFAKAVISLLDLLHISRFRTHIVGVYRRR